MKTNIVQLSFSCIRTTENLLEYHAKKRSWVDDGLIEDLLIWDPIVVIVGRLFVGFNIWNKSVLPELHRIIGALSSAYDYPVFTC